MNLNEIFSSKAIAARWSENINNTIPDLGEAFFPRDPSKRYPNDIIWYKGSTGIANSLMPSSLDAEMTLRQRGGLEKVEANLPFFREGFQITEKDAQIIEDALNTNDPYAAQVIDKIYSDSLNLIRGAQTAIERIRMGLLFPVNGMMGAHIHANGVKYDYVYDPSGKWKETNYLALTGGDAWTASDTSDPYTIIENAKKAINTKTGAELKYMIMNSVTFKLMSKSAALKNRFITTSGAAVARVLDKDVKRMIEDDMDLKIIIHDKQYNDESGKTTNYVPDNYVTFVPEGALGETRVGKTPEERSKKKNLDVSVVDGGITIASYETPHPVRFNIICSHTALPTFEKIDDVFTVKVA